MPSPFPFAESELFRSMPAHLMGRIISMLTEKKLARNETLFFKGDEGDGLYALSSGAVQISALSSGGREATFNIMKPGDVFGEIALLDGQPRTADAIAIKPSTLFFLPRAGFMMLLKDEPEFTARLIAILCSRLRRMSNLIEDFMLLDIRSRLARLLITAHENGNDKAVRQSQENLAQTLGTSRVTVNRHLQEWKREGWIDLGRGQINVLDRTALEAVIEIRLSDLDQTGLV